jgi:predicted lipoprotein
MSAAANASGESRPRRRISPRVILIALAVLVIGAMALDTTYRKPGETTPGGRKAFDPADYGAKTYPKVAATVTQSAVPIEKLLPAISKDPDAAGEQYGKRQGQGPWNFSTTATGTAQKAEAGLMEIKVKGLPEGTRFQVQTGPAINGTSLRDAAGFIEFGQFLNQVEYAGAGTALNEQVKAKVLKGVDPASMEGKQVSVTGAFSLVTPSVVTVTPVKLEVGA